MIKLQGLLSSRSCLLTALQYAFRAPKKIKSFQSRITYYNKRLDQYDRVFLIRPPNLMSNQTIEFPISIPMRVRHYWNPKKRLDKYQQNTSKIHWNRLTPNEILLGFQKLEYLEWDEMIEGLKYLSEVPGQQKHDWNQHIWVSKAFDNIFENFNRIKRKDYLPMYYLMKKLNCKHSEFWKKIYSIIEENLYELYPSEFEKFFLRYYKVSDDYFSKQMKQKFLTLMENRLRSFQPSNIIKVYEIYQEENRLDDYWKFNVFIPLFKSIQYTYKPKQLYKIFRFMLIINHEKDERLYQSLYGRLKSFDKLTLQQIEMFEEVLQEVKDLFVSHRVEPYFNHLAMLKRVIKKAEASQKKQVPIHELVQRDIALFLNKRKITSQNVKSLQNSQKVTESTPQLSTQ